MTKSPVSRLSLATQAARRDGVQRRPSLQSARARSRGVRRSHVHRRRRAPIRASASRPACSTPARRRGTCRCCLQDAAVARSSPASPTPTSPSPATTPSRAATTATRSGTSPTPAQPTLKTAYFCPASQSDVSVYKNLLFVSGEGLTGRLDCGAAGREGHGEQGSPARHPHLRHQRHRATRRTSATCRPAAARTRTRVLVDPKDPDNVYVYISGSSRRALAERARRAA